jgi:SAM-dependent methyltransferase
MQIIKDHLGGYVDGGHDATKFPILWKYIVRKYSIKSVIDIGCGQGHSTRYFQSLGCDILGVDGLEDSNRVLTTENFKLNDYTLGSALTDQKFDLCWSCEFVEHIDQQHIGNFINDFVQAKYLVMTHATPGQAARDNAHHHVNEQPQGYWIEKIQNAGFTFMLDDTIILRAIADADAHNREDGDYFNHFKDKGLIFRNNNF